jgi:hypothetical protein
MAGDWTQVPRWLKLSVVVMTLLLGAGLIALAVGIARTAGRMAATPQTIGELGIELPAGQEIRQVGAGDGRLYIAIAPPGGPIESILVLDVASGRRLGSLRPVPGP